MNEEILVLFVCFSFSGITLVYLWQDAVFALNCIGCESSDSVLHSGIASLCILEPFVISIFLKVHHHCSFFFFPEVWCESVQARIYSGSQRGID